MTLSIAYWQRAVHELAKLKQWHKREDGTDVDQHDPERIAARLERIHSEVSEAGECVALDQMAVWYQPYGKPEGFPIELADAVIRILDLAESLGIDIEAAMVLKHEYNKSRPERHGKKRI
jgi:hypothetical protein